MTRAHFEHWLGFNSCNSTPFSLGFLLALTCMPLSWTLQPIKLTSFHYNQSNLTSFHYNQSNCTSFHYYTLIVKAMYSFNNRFFQGFSILVELTACWHWWHFVGSNNQQSPHHSRPTTNESYLHYYILFIYNKGTKVACGNTGLSTFLLVFRVTKNDVKITRRRLIESRN